MTAALQYAERGGELEVVEVAEHHDVARRVERQDAVHEIVDDLGLRDALRLGDEVRGLELAEKGLIAALRVEVVAQSLPR